MYVKLLYVTNVFIIPCSYAVYIYIYKQQYD